MNIVIDKEFQSLIPPLTREEYEGLEQSILSEGCRDALVLWGDVLVDGHNRYDICKSHNIPYLTRKKYFATREDAKLWMIGNQLARRNINNYARTTLECLSDEIQQKQAEANKKQSDAGKQYGRGLPKKEEIALGEITQSYRPVVDTKKEIAKRANVGEQTASRVMTINKKIDAAIANNSTVAGQKPEELKRQLMNGDITINKAYQDMRREEKKQEVQQRIEDYAAVQTGVVDIEKTEKKYNIIYADPPWRYWESGNKNQALHYTTMSIDEICDLPVKDISDDNCVLFMWVTYPILQEAFRVIESWGFKYSTCAFVWVKKNKQKDTPFIGCGAWTRANSELCLLATKGNVMRLDASISQVVESPIEEHSKKPDVVRELITRLVGELPRVELFCRNPADGWDVWGNEA